MTLHDNDNDVVPSGLAMATSLVAMLSRAKWLAKDFIIIAVQDHG